jgi:hypothetical protein
MTILAGNKSRMTFTFYYVRRPIGLPSAMDAPPIDFQVQHEMLGVACEDNGLTLTKMCHLPEFSPSGRGPSKHSLYCFFVSVRHQEWGADSDPENIC